MANRDISVTGTRIQELLEDNSSPTKDVHVFWLGETHTPPYPTKFIALEPLYSTGRREWTRDGVITHVIRVRCCAKSIGMTTKLTSDAMNALPITEFGVEQTLPLTLVDDYYEAAFVARTIRAPETENQ